MNVGFKGRFVCFYGANGENSLDTTYNRKGSADREGDVKPGSLTFRLPETEVQTPQQSLPQSTLLPMHDVQRKER